MKRLASGGKYSLASGKPAYALAMLVTICPSLGVESLTPQPSLVWVFAMRLATPVYGRHLLVPVVFALSAPTFLMLYEVWMKELATGGRAADGSLDEQRQRIVRKVFSVEVLLVSTLLGVAHALLNASWETQGAWILRQSLVRDASG